MDPIIINGMLTSDQCADIINQLPDDSHHMPGGTTLAPGHRTDAVWNETHKTFNTHRIRLEQDSAAHVSSLIKPVSIESETYTVSNKDNFYANYYLPGESCGSHKDPSKYSICVTLNDEFEGGEFSIKNEPVKLKAGDGILFSGNSTHALSEIVSGKRWSLCIWIF